MDKGIVVVLVLISVFFMIAIGWYLDKNIHKFKRYGYFGIFLCCLIGNVALFSPGASLISILGGRHFPILLVGLMAACGALLGEIVSYNVGRVSGNTVDNQFWYEKVNEFMDKNGFFTVLLVSAVPSPIMNISGIVSGATDYSFLKFIIASFCGNWLQYTITAGIGYLSINIIPLKSLTKK